MQVSFGNYLVAKDRYYNPQKRQIAVEHKIGNYVKSHYTEWRKRVDTSLCEYLHEKNLDIVTTLSKDGKVSIHLARGQNFPVCMSANVDINPKRVPLKNMINKKSVITTIDPSSKPSKIENQIKKFAEDCFSFVGERNERLTPKKHKFLKELELDNWIDHQINY